MPESPAKLFQRFEEIGQKEILDIRQDVSYPNETKQPRAWGIQDAAQMIGRSVPWVRDNSADCPTDKNGRKLFDLPLINDLRKQTGTMYTRPPGSRPFRLAIANFKGGVGKTTTGIHLAQYAAMSGLSVLYTDLDSQGSGTLNLLNLRPDRDLGEEDTYAQAMLKDPEEFKYCIRSSYFHGVSVAPANLYLQNLELDLINPRLNRESKVGSPYARLHFCLEDVESHFDLIILDCPPNMGMLTSNAVLAANGLLVPIPPKALDRASFTMLSGSLRRIFESVDKPVDLVRILPTLHPGTREARKHEAKMREHYGGYITSNNMYICTEIEKVSSRLSSIYDLDKPMDKRETYLRALNCLNAVNQELIDDIKTVWEEQSHE